MTPQIVILIHEPQVEEDTKEEEEDTATNKVSNHLILVTV